MKANEAKQTKIWVVAELAQIYAAMVEKIEGEGQKDCEQRLSRAIGEKIEGRVFYKAVSILRGK